MKYYSEDNVKEMIDYAIAYGTDITSYCPSLDDYPSIELGWHTEEPTDEGWYLLNVVGTIPFRVAYMRKSQWLSTDDSRIRNDAVIAWQKISPYKEASDGE